VIRRNTLQPTRFADRVRRVPLRFAMHRADDPERCRVPGGNPPENSPAAAPNSRRSETG
jgi:hypothetical protein